MEVKIKNRQELLDIFNGGQGRLLSVVSALPKPYSNIKLQVRNYGAG